MALGVQWRTWLGLVPQHLNEFAVVAQVRLRSTRGESSEWYPEQAVLKVLGPNERVIPLTTVFETYRSTPRTQRQATLDRFLAPLPSFPDLENAKKSILPAIRNRYTFANELRNAARHWTTAITKVPPMRPLAEHLGLVLVYDEPDTIRLLGQEQLSVWDISFDSAMDLAIHNLRGRSALDWVELAPGVFESPYSDFHDAARLCLPDIFHRIPIRGHPVVTVPHRQSVLVAGDHDVTALEILYEVTRHHLKSDRPISSIPVRHDGRRWTIWIPETNHPQLFGWSELRAREVSFAYELQSELLKNTHQDVKSPSVIPVPVGSFIKTGCIWPAEGTPLLPAVDYVLFGENKSDMRAVPLQEVRDRLPHLLERAETWPPRWRALRQPNSEEMKQLSLRPIEALSAEML